MEPFDTPLRAAALGVLAVAATVLLAGLPSQRMQWRGHVLMLVAVALVMVLVSEALQ